MAGGRLLSVWGYGPRLKLQLWALGVYLDGFRVSDGLRRGF